MQDPYETQEFENSAQGNLLKGIATKPLAHGDLEVCTLCLHMFNLFSMQWHNF